MPDLSTLNNIILETFALYFNYLGSEVPSMILCHFVKIFNLINFEQLQSELIKPKRDTNWMRQDGY